MRFRRFRKLVFTEKRNSDEKVMLLLFLMPPLAIGVMLRLVAGYQFFDLSLEGSFLMGLLGGRIVGLLGGSLISLLPFGFHEWLAAPWPRSSACSRVRFANGFPKKKTSGISAHFCF